MKKYILVNENHSIILAEIESMDTNKNFLIIENGRKSFLTTIKLGKFVKEISYENGDHNRWYTVQGLGDGGFVLKRDPSSIPKGHDYDEATYDEKITEYTVRYNSKKDKFIVELEDDNAAELWAEAMKGEFINE